MLRRPLHPVHLFVALLALGFAAFAVVAEGAPPASGPAPSPASGGGRPSSTANNERVVRAAGDGGSSKADVSPPLLDDVEHMCALLTACEGLPIPPSLVPRDFGACVKTMTTEMTSASAVAFSLTLRECGLRANSCGALRTCALRGASLDTCNGRGKSSPAGFCDAEGRAISCWHEKVSAVRDCPRGGENCAVREGEALCTLGPCPSDMKESAPACSASGTRILRCEKGKLASLDCGAFGLKCVATSDGPGCATSTGKACLNGSKRCEGDVAIGCFNGRETRVDCTSAGLVCSGGAGPSAVGACMAPSSAAGSGAGAGAGPSAAGSVGSPPRGGPSSQEDAGGRCDPAAATRCDGASIAYCAAGARSRSYFCKALGFTRCVSDRTGTRCAP